MDENERRLLADLTSHPGWEVLKAQVQGTAKARATALSKLLLHTEAELDPHKVAYDRGYWKAMYDVVEKPERAVSRKPRTEE